MDKLILASNSPRRKEILEKFKIPFSIKTSTYKEIFTNEKPEAQVLKLSKGKIQALLELNPELKSSLILGADTCIDLDGSIIGKPDTKREAKEFLVSFSGRSHKVITGLTFYNGKNSTYTQDKSITLVDFANLTEKAINWYLNTNEWKGAAGGYKIQEQGYLLTSSISGSWYNVMGLPIRLFYGMVASQGISIF
ncbi:MAG: septum formation protein Maf [Spirochaetaceae bacterium]|nr:septum formation protein Maf [Spirochaetaceae bacterium]